MVFKAGLLARARGAAHIAVMIGTFAALVPSSLFAASSVTLAWDASTSTNIAGYRVYYGPASRTYTNTLTVGNATSTTISNLIAGATYYFTATTYDTDNLESDFSNEVGYTNIVLAPPTIALTSPANNAAFTVPATISLAAEVTANGHTITKVQFYNDTGLLGEATDAPYDFTWSSVAAGNYSLAAQVVYDSGSTVASTAASVTVTNLPPPTIALTAPANNAAFTAPATISLAANVTDNGHTITKVQFYNGATLLGEATTAPYAFTWGSVPAGIYSLSAQAVYDSGSTVASASANVTVAAAKPVSGLTFAADSGTYTAPFVDSNGTLSQPVQTGVTNGGQAIYTFNVTNGGNYLVSAMVIAPNDGENSLYVNIDADPTDPLMIWDIPICSVLTNATVSWRGNGNSDPASSQYNPKVFALSAGTHQLIIVGREANTTLGTITIAASTPPTIALTSPANGSAYAAPATINLAADVTVNGHTITKVQFYNGPTLLGEDATAPYAFTWGSVAAGIYSLSAQVVYDSDSAVASTVANVTVTNQLPPTIALTAPANNAAFTAPATISLAANVTANGHTITKVQFYNGTTLLGEATTAPYAFTWSSVAAGNYSFTAQAVYDSGSTVASIAANVTVTNLPPPTIALTAPANNAAFTAPATISLAAAVTANGHTITKVQFYNGATLLGEATAAPYAFTWSSVAAGNYSLSAQGAYDSGSTVASPTANVTVTNQLQPTIALTAPANNAAFTAPAAISLAANVTDNGHTITKVQFYSGATLLGEEATAPYVFNWNSITAAIYSLSAQGAYDSGSTVASPTANVTVTNQLQPTIALTAPANNAAFTAPAAISLAANVTDNGHTITKVQFYSGATLLGEEATAPYVFNWNSITAGIYSLSAQAVYDSGSTVASTTAYVTVTNQLAPTIALTAPANNAAFSAPATINLAANVTPNGHTITKVQFYNGATLLGEAIAVPYAFTWSSVAAGIYSLSAQAAYDSGSTVASPIANVTVTNQLPPTIALTAPANNAAFSAPATISLAADVTANGHAITKVQFYSDTDLLGEATNAPYAFTWSSVPAGSYSLSAQAVYDSGSVVASTAANVTVTNLPPPTIALTSPANNATFSGPATISLAADVTANGHAIAKVQFYNGTTLLGEAITAPYAFAWGTVPAGIYSLSAQAVYDSGSTVASTAASVTVTNQLPPTIALTAPANNAAFSAPATISLAANVTANGHAITKVQFYNSTTLLGEAATVPYAFAWGTIPAGIYSLSAQAVYDSGSTVASTTANVTVTNLLPPTIALAAPTNNATFTAPATIDLAADVTANGHTITKVQFYNGTTLLGEATNAPYALTWSSVPAGSYSLTAWVDYDSGSTIASTATDVTVTNLPSPTIALTSPANNAAFTAPATISMAASVTANGHTITKVQFYDSATLLGEDTTAPYTFTWGSVTAGIYSLTAQAVYDSGSAVASTVANVTVTNLPPPTIALTSPVNNAAFTAPATISLAANVTANGHTITKVQFYNSTTLLGEDTNAPYALTWSSVAAGNYSLTAQAVYDSGSTVASTAANVTVTNLPPPTIALTAPANNAAFTAPATISLTANITANGHTFTKVQFYSGATLLGEATTAPYAFTWNSAAAGNYSLTAQAVYDSGSIVASTAANVTVTNQLPPTIALIAPANNAAFTAPATISMAANVTANGHAITKVQFYNGTTFLGEDATAPYVFTWSSVAAGNYSLSAQAVYDSGSTVASTAANVTVTNLPPPTIALTAPPNNAAFTAPATISLAANVTANGHVITKAQFYNGTTLLGEATNAPYAFIWSSVAAGNYSLTAQVNYDSGSTIASTAADVTVTNLPSPTIALTSPANNAAYTAPATISLAANVTANGHALTKVQFYNGTTLLGEDTTAPYVFTWNSVAAGNYNLTAQAVYDSGSIVASTAANVTVTNLPPPTIALTAPADNTAYTEPATFDLAADVTANGHSINKVQFYNGTTLLGEATNAPYAFTWGSVPAGNYSLTAQVDYDSGSTIASTAADVTVTNLPSPTIALTSPANNAAFSAPATISLAANVTANGHAITQVQFYNGTTLLGELTTAPYVFTWNSVAAGNYSLSAQAVYDSGDTIASTAAIVAVTELVPPTIALTSPANNAAFTAPAIINLAANVTANGHVITKVQFYNGTSLLGEATNAPYAFTWSSAAAGIYSLSAQAVYDSGIIAASTTANVAVTNLPAPTIALTAPANNSAFTAPATISLAANVTANGHAITKVEFYNGTTLLGEATNAPYAFTWGSVPAGNYSLTAQVDYDSGSTIASTAADVTVTNLPSPTIALTSPANNAAFSAPATISLAANVTANGHAITQVQFYNGTTLLGELTTVPYVFTWNNVAAGNYSLTAQAVYDSGSVVASTAANVTVTNLLPPTITLTLPANNAAFTAPATISLAANVTANGRVITKVQFYNGATFLGEDTAAPYAFIWGSVPAGIFSLSAQAVYDSGSTVASSAANVTVTNLPPPTIALTSPANNAAFTAPATISLAANVTANDHAITKVQFYNGASLLGEETNTPYVFTWNGVATGTYSLSAQAVYNSGSIVASAVANVTVTNLPPPTIALTVPAGNTAYTEPATIDLAADVTANGHSIAKVQFYNGTTLLGEATNAPYAFTWGSVSAGTYSLTARLVYDAGPTLDSTPAVNVLVAAAKPPDPPAIALTSPVNKSASATPATLSLAATVTANGHAITKVQFYNGTILLGENTTPPYIFTWSNVAAGNYSLSAQAVYDTGSIVASPAAIVAVTKEVPPAITLTSPANNSAFTAPATIDLAANVTANGHTITKVQFYNGATLLGEDTNAPYAFTWSGVPADNYSLTAQVAYDSGSIVASTAANATVTNLPPPTIALTSPANNAAFTAPGTISLVANVTANGHMITKVQFYNGATLLGEATTAPYVFTWSSVAAAIYSLSAKAVYDLGSTVASTAANVTVTNLPPPTIALTAPPNNAAFTAPGTINLAANVTANGHTITKVQFYNGATLLGEDATAPYVLTWSSVAAGIYSLSAQAVYDSGSTVASTAANVTVTNLPPPTIALTAPPNNAAFTAPATISLAANVTANGHTITKVQFYNGATLLDEDATAPYVFTWSSVAAGIYSLTAQVVYDSGSTVASTAANVTVTNLPPPTIALTAPPNNAAFTAPATFSLAANLTANGHTITKVQFYNGTTFLGEATNAPYAITWGSITAGIYSLTAQAVYDSGSAVASTVANVTVTNLPPPTIALTSPVNNAAFTAPATISLAANFTANGHTITKVQFYNGSTLLGEDTNAPYALTWSSVAAGNYSITAQAVYDSGSIVASTAATATVTNLPPPTIALTSPANKSASAAPAIISLAANVTANGHAITKVQFYNGTTLLGENTNPPYIFIWRSVVAGNYTLCAHAVYDSGSIVASPAAIVAVTKQVPPALALTSPANNSAFTVPATISLAASVTANGHAINKVQFYNGATLLGETTNAPYIFTWRSVAAGNYSLSAQAVYDSGSTIASPAANVMVTNLPPPTIALTAPADNTTFTAPATLSLAASVSANGHAIIKVQFYNDTTLLGEAPNAPYAVTWSSVPAGTYSLTARLVYDAGVTLDSTPAVNGLAAAARPPDPPTIALTSPTNKSASAAPATLSLAASVTANSHAITKVQFYNGTILLGENTTPPLRFHLAQCRRSQLQSECAGRL
jgi:sulfur relay (sulfurtransferase) complex TusBCD TusD component (DsrE family)